MAEGGPLSRVSALAVPVLILLVLTVGTFVGVVRYTTVFDPAGGTLPSDASHHDPRPCLRYPTAPQPNSLETASLALLEAGLTSSDVSDLVGDLYARARAREASLHTGSEVEEHLVALGGEGGLFSRLVIAVKRDRLRERLTSILAVTPATRRTIASLPAKQREVVEAQWARDPAVFVLPGLLNLVRQLKYDATDARLDEVQAMLEAQISRGETPSLEALRDSHTDEQLQDGWGFALSLERTGDGEFTLASLGADQTVGGSGYDSDVERKLTLQRGEPEVPPEPSAACAGKTEVSLSRKDVDDALANLSELSKEARVVPAVTDGVVSGFRLKSLRPGFFSRVGLCEGDVVSTLNGMSLASLDKALEAYSALRNATRVEVVVLRGGRPLTLTVTLR